MKVFNIGELIRQRRIECGFTQEELCHGICEPPTMSRIECGWTTPSRSKLTAILQRLGMVGDKYYALLSENELVVANLQSEINSCIIRRDFSEGLMKLEELEQAIEADDHILKQYILKSRVALGKEMDGQIVNYSFDERIEMLYAAIRMTVPGFTIDNIDKYILGTDEIQIIGQIATSYTYENKHWDSIVIYSRLLNYVESHIRILNQESSHSPVSILISYNYSRALYLNDQYLEAIIIADIGLRYSRNLRNSSYLGSLLYIKAYCLYFLGNYDDSKYLFYQCYYVYSALEDSNNIQLARKTIHDLFNCEI